MHLNSICTQTLFTASVINILFLSSAFGCSELHFVSNSPTIIYDSGNDKFDVTFQFEHGNPGGGTYECFLRDSERCPPVVNTTVCNEGDTVTFTGLDLGVWYTCGIRCTFEGIKRSISRTFGTPSSSIGCTVNLINDGISYVDHTDDGNATTCFMWSSSFLRLFGFECSIDNEDAVAL